MGPYFDRLQHGGRLAEWIFSAVLLRLSTSVQSGPCCVRLQHGGRLAEWIFSAVLLQLSTSVQLGPCCVRLQHWGRLAEWIFSAVLLQLSTSMQWIPIVSDYSMRVGRLSEYLLQSCYNGLWHCSLFLLHQTALRHWGRLAEWIFDVVLLQLCMPAQCVSFLSDCNTRVGWWNEHLAQSCDNFLCQCSVFHLHQTAAQRQTGRVNI